MLSKLYARKNRENGFTLIELLIVVIIIGILAAIALPIFMDQTKGAVDASVKSDVRNTVTNVNEWRATNDAALPASAEDYATKGGVLATSKGAYVNVAFTSDNDYVVCGYNPGGKNYADYQHAWAFTASTGKFTSLADIGGECTDAVHVRATPTDDSGDNAGDGSGSAGSGRVVTVTRTTDGSSTYLAYDPNGKTGTPAGGSSNTTTGDPGTGPSGGGGSPTTGDPATPVVVPALTAVDNSSYHGPIVFRMGTEPQSTYVDDDGLTQSKRWKAYELDANQTIQATGTPIANGLNSGDSVTSSMTDVKIYDVSGNPKVADTLSNCTFTAKARS